MRLTRNRRKTIKVPLILPIAVVISGVFIGLSFNSASKPKQIYPTVLSAQSESVFYKLLNPLVNINDETTSASQLNEVRFTEIKEITNKYKGNYSIYIKDLSNDKTYTLKEDQKIFSASLYKLPTAISTLRLIDQRKLKFTDTVIYTQADYEGGTGGINQNSFGTNFTVEQLLTQLLKNSDNVAQNMLARKIGYNTIYKTVQQLTPDVKPDEFVYSNISTSEQMGTLIENSLKTNYLDPDSKKYLYDLMFQTSFDDRIAQYITGDLRFSHKIGSWPETSSWHDCGAVFNEKYQAVYVVCLMTNNVNYSEFLEVAKFLGEFISNPV